MTNKIQIAYFLREFIERADIVFYKLNDELNGIFDLAPNNFALPKDAPAEIPRLQATSSNGLYSLSISLTRIDLSLNRKDTLLGDDVIADFKSLIQSFSHHLIVKYKIFRIGLISHHMFNDKNSVKRIQDKYIKDNVVPNLHEILFRYNKRFTLNNFIVNDVTEINCSNEGFLNPITGKNDFVDYIILAKDINNVPLFEGNFDESSIHNFVEEFYSSLLSDAVKTLI